MKVHKTRSIICRCAGKGVRFRHCVTASALVLFLHCLAVPCIATELKQETVEAFDRYIRVTDARRASSWRSLSLGGLLAPITPTTPL